MSEIIENEGLENQENQEEPGTGQETENEGAGGTPESIDDGVPQVTFTVRVAETMQAPVDQYLQTAGMAADAKATGDAINAAKDEMQTALDNAIGGVQDDINDLETGLAGVPGDLYPVGSIYISTSATAPTFGGENWRWKEILLPVKQGDLVDGTRSYAEMQEGDTPGTLHFWLRIADAEVESEGEGD